MKRKIDLQQNDNPKMKRFSTYYRDCMNNMLSKATQVMTKW